jgi:hypothetical protein
MDEGFEFGVDTMGDVGDTGIEVFDAVTYVDIEPIVEIGDELEQVRELPELIDLQNDVDALEIEPFEESPDTSGVTRGLAGTAAGITAISGLFGVPPATQFDFPANDDSAIYQTVESPSQNTTLDQIAEQQGLSVAPSTRELLGQLNETIQDAWSPPEDE